MNTLTKQRSGAIDTARRSTWQMRAVAIIAAIAVNVIVLAIGRAINGEYPVTTVGGDDQTIKFGQVIIVTALVGLIAWGVVALLERITGRPRTTWVAVALILFVLSLLGPIGSGVGTSSKITLACMHLGTAATIIPLMRNTIRTRE